MGRWDGTGSVVDGKYGLIQFVVGVVSIRCALTMLSCAESMWGFS